MFVFNMKCDSKKTFKIIFIILFILILIMFAVGIYNVFFNKLEYNDNCENNNFIELSGSNFTNVLKSVHEDLKNYEGTQIKFVGFVYRLYDFPDDKFVLARNMIISSDYQAVVVGFLCHLNGANKYKDGTWVSITGKVTRGEYHGEIPIIEIEKIEETKVPSEEYVLPPTEKTQVSVK